jgi:peptidoglycan/LPS O-acetylase OafA/YrhL
VSTSGPDPGPVYRLRRLPALDALRGLAVIGVLLFHADLLRGGYLGVDLFFVLSGFLITSLLLAEWGERGSIDLRSFWVRRARRLFPALAAVLLAVAVVFALLHATGLAAPSELGRLRGDGLAATFYVANWRTILSGASYWDLFAAPSPLEHLWSLAIEEQFYLLWPLVLLVVLRLSPRRRARSTPLTTNESARRVVVVSLALTALSAGAMWVLYDPRHPSRAYLGTDTRGAAILMGAALAGSLTAWGPVGHDRLVRLLDGAGMVAAVGLAVAWTTLDGQSRWLYRGGFWLTEGAVVVLIACSTLGERSRVARLLARRPLIWCGLISYGLYLWHWPIYVALSPERTGLHGSPLTAVRLLATFAIAIASYRWLEQPIRRQGLRFSTLPRLTRPAIVIPVVAAVVVVALLLATSGVRQTDTPTGSTGDTSSRDLTSWPPPSARPPRATRLLVVGDSVAHSLGPLLAEAAGRPVDPHFVVAERAFPDCSILDDQLMTRSPTFTVNTNGDCDRHWSGDVTELRPELTLVVLGGGFLAQARIDGRWQHPCDDGWRVAYMDELRRQVDLIRAGGSRVALTLAPEPLGPVATLTSSAQVACFNDVIREVAASEPGILLIDLPALVCPEGSCPVTLDDEVVRADGLHYSGPGGRRVAAWILEGLTA